jgi:hypothetical protein
LFVQQSELEESSVYKARPAVKAVGWEVVCEVDFMVKLLRACVWMPRRKKAKKDVISCDKLREAANRL